MKKLLKIMEEEKPFSYGNKQCINCVIEPNSESKGGLYIGNIEAANDIEMLKKMGINAVLTVKKNLH